MDSGSNGDTRSNGNRNTFTNGNGNGRTTVSNGITRSNGNGRTTASNGVTRSNGNGYSTNGYVRDAVNSFTRSPGNSYVSTTGNDITRTTTNGNGNTDKQVSNKLVVTNNDLNKPKLIASTIKATTPTLTTPAKPKSNDIKLVADKPKTSTTPASKVGFGWRSSVNHSNGDQKSQKLQNSVEDSNVSAETPEDEEEEDEFEDDLDDDLDDITTTRPPTTRATVRPAIRTTQRPTTKSGVEYTTYRVPETTRPQTTPAITTRVVQTTTRTTSRPQTITTKSSADDDTNDLAPNKKQHRMGSWVDSESLDYVEGDNEDDDSSDAEADVPAGIAPDPPQPLIQEFEGQLPERVQEESPALPAPLAEAQKFARQSARNEDEDDSGDEFGQRLEDALPGVPGTDYPIFATVPRTNFDCRQHEWPGYYADVETQCQVWQTCSHCLTRECFR